MAVLEQLHVLTLRANDMVQETLSSFEEHFLWLDEVLAEARRTLASEDLLLLPKTPSAAPKKSRRVIKEDVENSPPAGEFSSPPPRRQGRLCSKLATQKIKEQTKLSKVKKLRRPSSPVAQVPPSTARRNWCRQASASPSPARSDKSSESPAPESVTVTPPSTKRPQRNVRLVLEPVETNTPPGATASKKEFGSPQKDESSPKETESSQHKEDKDPSQVNDPSLQDDGSSNKIFSSSPQKVNLPVVEVPCPPKVTSVREESSSPKELSSQAKIPCHSPKELASRGIESDVLGDHREAHKDNVEQEDVIDLSQSSMKDGLVSESEEEDLHLHLADSYDDIMPLSDAGTCKEKEKEEDIAETSKEKEEDVAEAFKGNERKEKEEDMEVVWESSELKDKAEQVTSSQVILSTQAKQGSPSQECSTQHISSPQKVPSTRQKVVEVQNVPSPFVPAPRVTRTKQRALDTHEAPTSDHEPPPPSAPAPRVRRTKQKTTKVQEVEDVLSTNTVPLSTVSPAPAPRVTRTKQKAPTVPDVPVSSDSPPEPASPSFLRNTCPKQEVVKIQKPPLLLLPESCQPPSAPAPRMTRTKQRAIEAQEAAASVPQPATRVTRTKQKVKENQQAYTSDANVEDEEEKQASKESRVKDSGVYSLGVKKDDWSSIESLSTEGSGAPPLHNSSPPRRITRSKVSKLQQAQHSPKILPGTSNFQRACCSPRGTGYPSSPQKNSSEDRKLAAQSGRDGVHQLMPEMSGSPLRVVRHSPDKKGKVVEAKLPLMGSSAGRITPSIISRMQPFLTASSSSASSASSGHKRIITRTVGTPNESRQPTNIVTGITSFIKSQPVRPNREDERLKELQKKREREEETHRKKEQLLKAKTEERKRRNEERMRRVRETVQEQERQVAAAAKEKLERERRLREERQREEEEQQRLLAKKKAEEKARRLLKLKELQEREKEREKKRLEEEKRQKLEEEKRQRLEEEERQAKYYAQKKKLEEPMKVKLTVSQMMKMKFETEQPKPKDGVFTSKDNEQQPPPLLKQQEAKQPVTSTYKETVALNSTYTSSTKADSGVLNSTYTKPMTDAKSDSYEMTPLQPQPKRGSSSLNNYDIDDLHSEDSTDDDASPKKRIPQWAMRTQLQAAILQQEYYPPQLNDIFPPSMLLVVPDLTRVFTKQKRRFKKRTSSALWETPPSKVFRGVFT